MKKHFYSFGWMIALALILQFQSAILMGQQKQPVSSLQEDGGVTFDFTAASSGAQATNCFLPPGTCPVGAAGTSLIIDNRQGGFLDWEVTYSTTTTVTGVSLLFQVATDLAGVPGTWSAYPGTLNSGINPNTVATLGGAVTDATGPKYPWLRMNLTSLTGSGHVQGKLYGWKRRPTYVTVTAGGGCPGTIGTPCVVVGTKTNNNAAPGANNVGVLPAIANAAVQTWTEGDQVLESVDLQGNQRVTVAGNSVILSGQQSVTGSAVALATNTTKAACVKALVSNLINVFVGPTGITTSTGYLLAPGESFCSPVTNTNLLFVIASTTGASVSWIASR